MLNKQLFKLRTLNGLRRALAESRLQLTNIPVCEDKDIKAHDELLGFIDELEHNIEVTEEPN